MPAAFIGPLVVGLVLLTYGILVLLRPAGAARVFESTYDAAGSNAPERRRRRAAGEGAWTPSARMLRVLGIILVVGGAVALLPALLLALLAR